MEHSEYSKLLTALATAKEILAKNAGSLTAADLRIRCLTNIAIQETQRACREAQSTPALASAALEATETPT